MGYTTLGVGITDYDCEGILTINSVAMNRAAWATLDLSRLAVEVDKRGRNRVIPGAAGVVTLPVRKTETRHNLGLIVVGTVNTAGAAATDARTTLWANLEHIYDNVVDQTGALAATWVPPGAASRSANVQVLGMHEQRKYLNPTFSYWRGTLEINIPGGRFE